MKNYSVLLNDDTTVEFNTDAEIEIGDTVTGTGRDENGNPFRKTGTVTEVLDITERD